MTAVAGEVWKVAPSIENQALFGSTIKNMVKGGTNQAMKSLFDQPVIQGQDIPSHQGLKLAMFPRHGGGARRRSLPRAPGSRDATASSSPRRSPGITPTPRPGEPKKVGDTLKIGEETFEIIGLYNTGSMLLDVIIIMDIDTARRVVRVPKDTVSSFYVEARDPSKNEELSELIESKLPGVDARGVNEIMANFGDLMNQLDLFLLATVALALLVGVVGIINTMLMSTTERFAEFGVLRTNGWSRSNVLTLVTAESAYLGLLAGLAGFVLAVIFTTTANQFITSSGLSLQITWRNAMGGLLLSIVMGTLGGLYPAWKASRLVPMDAIRLGNR